MRRLLRCGRAGKAGNEIGVLGRRDPLLDIFQNSGQVTSKEVLRVEPQPGKNLALVSAEIILGVLHVFAAAQDEVIEFLIKRSPHNVFAHAVATINGELLVEVVAGAGGGDFSN